tara:strand:- start:7988 stop:8545 length:558 start_codon:yes stop_codon:yes gene_type:complete
MSNIDEFINNFQFAGARPSLYQVTIGSVDGIFESDEQMQFMCKNAQLPASTVGAITANFLGRQIKLPGVRSYEDLALTFYLDEDMNVRHQFENWMHQMAKFKSAYGSNVRIGEEGIATDLKVEQMSKDENVLRQYRFVKAFPTSVSQIDLGYDQGETLEEFTVTFAYQYFDIPEPSAQSIDSTQE